MPWLEVYPDQFWGELQVPSSVSSLRNIYVYTWEFRTEQGYSCHDRTMWRFLARQSQARGRVGVLCMWKAPVTRGVGMGAGRGCTTGPTWEIRRKLICHPDKLHLFQSPIFGYRLPASPQLPPFWEEWKTQHSVLSFSGSNFHTHKNACSSHRALFGNVCSLFGLGKLHWFHVQMEDPLGCQKEVWTCQRVWSWAWFSPSTAVTRGQHSGMWISSSHRVMIGSQEIMEMNQLYKLQNTIYKCGMGEATFSRTPRSHRTY